MEFKVKVEYVEADTLDELRDLTNKAIEAIQVNVRNQIRDIKTIVNKNGYVVQITYDEITYEEDKQILNESIGDE